MSRKNQKGNYMWVPQKLSHICSCIYFFHKVLILKSKCLFLVVKEKKFSDIQVVLIMPWLSVNSFVFSLDWKIHFHLDFFLGVAREMFQTCSVDNFTKWTPKIWMIKLWKIDTRYGEWIGMWQQWLVIFAFCFYF